MPMTQEQKVEGVRALLNPRSIAIVGASDRPGNWALRVYQTLRRFDYSGPIYPVNPRNKTVWNGLTCYPSLTDLPDAPDHVVVIVPGSAAIDSIADAGKVKARSATVYSGGFGEGGDPKGRELAARLRQAIEQAAIAVSGPNCMGNLAAPNRFMTIPDDRIVQLEPGPTAVVGQSGGIVMALQRALSARGVHCSYAITSGNEIGLYTSDYIRYLADDAHVRVIVCFIESIRHAAEFRRACDYACGAGKPVVAIKIGGSEESRRAALAHTGSLAGALNCFDAVAETVGVIRVDSLDEAVETAEYFCHAPVPKGPRLCAMTFSGGMKGLMLEAAERHGLSFPPLAPETLAQVDTVLGVGTSLGNPLDAGFAALSSADAYFKCIEILRGDPNIDLLLVQEELPPVPRTNNKVDNLLQVDRMVAERPGPPVAVVSMISYPFTDHTREFRARLKHLPVLQEIDKALKAAGAAGRYGALRAQMAAAAADSDRVGKPNIAPVLRRRSKAVDGLCVLNEADSKELLRAYGIRTPREAIAGSVDTAIMAARDIGFPVVLKLLDAQVPHKSDIGGVILNIRSENELRAAYARLAQNFAKARPAAKLEQAIVAEQVTGGVELVLGVQRDPEVGPVVMFGSGGINLELHKDVSFGAVPLPLWQAKSMIARTAAGRLLEGYRGAPPADAGSVLAALTALGRLAHDLGEEVESIDINPVVALPDGQGAVALDALVVLRR
ncbi:MAG: acetate--CoA ligase family protein [Hyphomicrobiales bacterium]|nr:acetate--CoA ligase family protein [Hyphomicrobiales bacterium]